MASGFVIKGWTDGWAGLEQLETSIDVFSFFFLAH